MTGEKDILPFRHTRQKNIEQETEDHHPSGLRTQDFERDRDDGFVVGQDASNMKPQL